jgi:hypothetical protein
MIIAWYGVIVAQVAHAQVAVDDEIGKSFLFCSKCSKEKLSFIVPLFIAFPENSPPVLLQIGQ